MGCNNLKADHTEDLPRGEIVPFNNGERKTASVTPWFKSGPMPIVHVDYGHSDAVVFLEGEEICKIERGYQGTKLRPEAEIEISNLRKIHGDKLKIVAGRYSNISEDFGEFNGA